MKNKIVLKFTYDVTTGAVYYTDTTSNEDIIRITKKISKNEVKYIRNKMKAFIRSQFRLLK